MELVESWLRSHGPHADHRPRWTPTGLTSVTSSSGWAARTWRPRQGRHREVHRRLHGPGLAPATVARRYRSCSSCSAGLPPKARSPRTNGPDEATGDPVTPPPILSDADLRSILAACKSKPTMAARRVPHFDACDDVEHWRTSLVLVRMLAGFYTRTDARVRRLARHGVLNGTFDEAGQYGARSEQCDLVLLDVLLDEVAGPAPTSPGGSRRSGSANCGTSISCARRRRDVRRDRRPPRRRQGRHGPSVPPTMTDVRHSPSPRETTARRSCTVTPAAASTTSSPPSASTSATVPTSQRRRSAKV